MKILNSGNAFRALARFLHEKHDIMFSMRGFNPDKLGKYRHMLFFVSSFSETKMPKYYALFKRGFFMEFNNQFKSFCSEHSEHATVGESINKQYLDQAILSGASDLLFIYEDGRVFKADPIKVKGFCEDNDLVREQYQGEVTYSFPISIMERFDDL